VQESASPLSGEHITGEPAHLVVMFEDHRHPVVDRSYQFVRSGRDNRIGPESRARMVPPDLIESRKAEDRIVFYMDVERDFVAPIMFPYLFIS
jgi:hypothetical protein